MWCGALGAASRSWYLASTSDETVTRKGQKHSSGCSHISNLATSSAISLRPLPSSFGVAAYYSSWRWRFSGRISGDCFGPEADMTTSFEDEVLGRISSDYEAAHTNADDIARDLKRPVTQAEVLAALLSLA